jgi:hypothetical protein
MSEERKVSGPKTATALPKTYVEWRDPFPAGPPTVRIIFHGLFCFFFRGKDMCFVGTHNTTREPGGPHAQSHPHHYEVYILTLDNGNPTELDRYPAPDGNPLAVPRMNVITTGATFPGGVSPGAYVYTGPRHAEFDRGSDDDRRDWRWIIDLEDVYPLGVKGRKAGTFMPGVNISNGLFHTLHRTEAAFDLVPEGAGSPIPLNHVAEKQAADIYLNDRGSVKITGGPVGTRLLESAPGRTFVIFVYNLCNEQTNPECNYRPEANEKEHRNDFFLYYETFDKAQTGPEYQLIKRGGPRIADDTPCGAVGYGGTPEP